MFVVGKIGEKSYYTKSQAQLDVNKAKSFADYLTKNNSKQPYFSGKLAETYGLVDKPFDNDAFCKVFDGFKPDGSKAVKNAGAEDHQPGIEFCLTLPKSLSILYASADDELRQKIMDLVDKSCNAVLMPVAKDLLPSNQRAEYRCIDPTKTEALISTFTHYENRYVDPHLHKHIQIFNQAKFYFEDGTSQILAVDYQDVFRHQKEYSSKVNALIAAELELIGIKTIEDVANEHSFKVAGIPDDVADKFIDRSKEIQAWAKANKLKFSSYDELEEKYTAWQKEQVRKASAEDKKDLSYNEIMAEFKTKLDAVGFDFDKFKSNNLAQTPTETMSVLDALLSVDKQLIESIEEKLISKSGTFSRTQFNTEIINTFKNKVRFKNLAQIETFAEKAFNRFKNDSSVVQLDKDKFTTKQVIVTEHKVVELALELANQKSVISLDKARQILAEFNGNKITLNQGQSQACKLVCMGHNLVSITGDAGTGKTSTVIKFANQLHQDTHTVYGLATAGITSNALKDAHIQNTSNIANFIASYNNGKIDFAKPPYFIIDEAGMVGSVHMKKLLEIATKHNGKVLLVGDTKQFSAVDYGMALTNINKAIPQINQARLDENMRQQNKVAKDIAECFRDKKVDEALSILQSNNLLHVSKKPEDAITKLVNDYFADTTDITRKTVLAGTNKTVNQINDKIRTQLLETHALDASKQVSIRVKKGKSTVLTEERYFVEGDRVILKEKTKLSMGMALDNGTVATIKSIDTTNEHAVLTLSIDRDGEFIDVQFDTGKHNNFNHAYCQTAYKSQGQTLDNVYVYSDGRTSSNQSYVEFSRHKANVNLYIAEGNLNDFKENAKRSQDKFNAVTNDKCQDVYKEFKKTEDFTKQLREQGKKKAVRDMVRRTGKHPSALTIDDLSIIVPLIPSAPANTQQQGRTIANPTPQIHSGIAMPPPKPSKKNKTSEVELIR
ncbi:MAG: MobF family relaxase [Gallionella sp.]|nr:MobF family relaxase [Gallionella sp.]